MKLLEHLHGYRLVILYLIAVVVIAAVVAEVEQPY